jgi:hypothetical protein
MSDQIRTTGEPIRGGWRLWLVVAALLPFALWAKIEEVRYGKQS